MITEKNLKLKKQICKDVINVVKSGQARLVNRSYIQIDGLSITNTSQNWIRMNNTSGGSSDYNIIKNCEIQNSTLYGIFLNAGSDDNLVEGNSISQSGYGMRIKSSTLNLIINNSILDNNKGMYFCCGARNNTVTRNRFINNTDWHASDQYNNIWNKEAVGNYWDDYSGSDTNGDGIGEVVYTISEGYSSDEFPIVAQSFFND